MAPRAVNSTALHNRRRNANHLSTRLNSARRPNGKRLSIRPSSVRHLNAKHPSIRRPSIKRPSIKTNNVRHHNIRVSSVRRSNDVRKMVGRGAETNPRAMIREEAISAPNARFTMVITVVRKAIGIVTGTTVSACRLNITGVITGSTTFSRSDCSHRPRT